MKLFHRLKFKIFQGNYNALLLGLIFLFACRPYDGGPVYLGVWKLLLTTSMCAAIFNCNHERHVKIGTIALAIPTVLLLWWDLYCSQEWSLIATSILSVLFTSICAISILYDVFKRSKVSFESLRGVACAYFLIAITFAYLFWVIEWSAHGSFSIEHEVISALSYGKYLSEMLYFSFVTLLTIGYGDIVPVKHTAQSATIFEGMIGQFYMAILVARLVSIYSLSSHLKNKDI